MTVCRSRVFADFLVAVLLSDLRAIRSATYVVAFVCKTTLQNSRLLIAPLHDHLHCDLYPVNLRVTLLQNLSAGVSAALA